MWHIKKSYYIFFSSRSKSLSKIGISYLLLWRHRTTVSCFSAIYNPQLLIRNDQPIVYISRAAFTWIPQSLLRHLCIVLSTCRSSKPGTNRTRTGKSWGRKQEKSVAPSHKCSLYGRNLNLTCDLAKSCSWAVHGEQSWKGNVYIYSHCSARRFVPLMSQRCMDLCTIFLCCLESGWFCRWDDFSQLQANQFRTQSVKACPAIIIHGHIHLPIRLEQFLHCTGPQLHQGPPTAKDHEDRGGAWCRSQVLHLLHTVRASSKPQRRVGTKA